MSPVQWAIQPLKNYAKFSGRAPRAEFWWFFLFITIIYFVMTFLLIGSLGGILAASQDGPGVGMMGAVGATAIFMMLLWLALLLPTIAVQTRRLHDIDRSGWWIVGFYALYAVYTLFTMGSAFSAASGEVPTESDLSAIAGAGILGLLMLIYSIVLLVFFCLPGTRGENRYGADPYGPQNLDEVFA